VAEALISAEAKRGDHAILQEVTLQDGAAGFEDCLGILRLSG